MKSKCSKLPRDVAVSARKGWEAGGGSAIVYVFNYMKFQRATYLERYGLLRLLGPGLPEGHGTLQSLHVPLSRVSFVYINPQHIRLHKTHSPPTGSLAPPGGYKTKQLDWLPVDVPVDVPVDASKVRVWHALWKKPLREMAVPLFGDHPI